MSNTDDPPYNAELETRLNALLEYTSRDPTGFRENFWEQALVVSRLATIWPKLTASQQTQAREILLPNLPRLDYSDTPASELTRVLKLGREIDIQRALCWTPDHKKVWKPEVGEGVYNGVTGWLGQYLEHVKYNSVPLAYHFWSGVVCISAAARRNFYVERDAYRIWMNMFIILTGVKGTTKSFAYDQAIDILRRLNKYLGMENKIRHVNLFPEDATQEFIVQELAGLNYKQMVNVPGLDGWMEPALGDATALIHCDELSNFLGKGTYNISKKAPFLTSICFGSTYGKGTKGEGQATIENMAVGVFALTAPEWMRGTIHSDAMSGGLVDRWEIIHRPMCVERAYSKPEILDPVRAGQLAADLQKLAHPPSAGRQMMLNTPAAEEWFEDLYYSLHDKRKHELYNPNVKSLGRFTNQILRLGAILALSDFDTIPMIGLNHLQKAKEILDVEEPFFADFIEQASISTTMEDACGRLIRFISQKGGWVGKSELTKRFSMVALFRGRGGPAATIQQFLDDLVEIGRLVSRSKGRGKEYTMPGGEK